MPKSLSFSDAVSRFCDKVPARIKMVRDTSIIETIEVMQWIGTSTAYPQGKGGNLPVDTGWLMASLQASTSDMPKIDPDSYPPESAHPGFGLHSVPYVPDEIYNVVRGAALGETIYLGYTAAYAAFQEYGAAGTNGGGGRGFVRLAAQRWRSIVAKNVRLAKERVRPN